MIRNEVLEMTTERLSSLISGIVEDINLEEPEELFGAILFCLVKEMRGEMTPVEVAYGVTRVLGQFLEHSAQEENNVKNMFPRGPNGLCPENN